MKTIPACILICATVAAAAASSAQTHEKDALLVGAVEFPVACNAQAASIIEQAVAQLHHMMYLDARSLFNEATKADAKCAMALWGIAMTYIHPLWPDRPSIETLALGEALMSRAVQMGGDDEREDAYIATTRAYFEHGAARSENERLLSFEQAWKSLYELDPSELEAKSFYALSQLATADPGDKTYAKQLRAGAMVEEVLDVQPDHPGAHHYIIHAYDFPGLAVRALPVARNYGIVGPEVPHALHMMSHIFTRLGHWDESIKWNRKSATAAWQLSKDIGAISRRHYLHALDYLAYAYLQRGEDEQALDVVQTFASLTPPFDSLNPDAQAYALAATPARYALERHDWPAAAKLDPHIPRDFPWQPKHEAYVAQTHFARGIGLAHEGRFEEAAVEAATLQRIRNDTENYSAYWAKQVEIQYLAVEAWIHFLSGDTDGGTGLMRQAATLEASTSKSPVTPGEVIPAAELLGDMLAKQELYEEAMASYQVALRRSPQRLNSLSGAARALEMLDDNEAASVYYAKIAIMTDRSSARPAVKRALAKTKTR